MWKQGGILLSRVASLFKADGSNDVTGNQGLWRQGDVLIASVESLPCEAMPLPHWVLAEGEVTGHSHRIEGANLAELLEFGDARFLRVFADSARLIHQEHGTITLKRGIYRVWRQREYTPRAIVTVRD